MRKVKNKKVKLDNDFIEPRQSLPTSLCISLMAKVMGLLSLVSIKGLRYLRAYQYPK